jgi:hypothetical protein
MNEFRRDLPQAIEWALAVGMTQMGTAGLGGGMVNGVTSLSQIQYSAGEYNRMGAVVKRAGLQLFLHNEGFENSRLDDGRLTYPVLLEALDPELVKMQFQMSSMRTIGDPIMYFTNYPGRFISAHVHGGSEASLRRLGMTLPVKRLQCSRRPGRGRGGRLGSPSATTVWIGRGLRRQKIGAPGISSRAAGRLDLMVKGAGYLKTLSERPRGERLFERLPSTGGSRSPRPRTRIMILPSVSDELCLEHQLSVDADSVAPSRLRVVSTESRPRRPSVLETQRRPSPLLRPTSSRTAFDGRRPSGPKCVRRRDPATETVSDGRICSPASVNPATVGSPTPPSIIWNSRERSHGPLKSFAYYPVARAWSRMPLSW